MWGKILIITLSASSVLSQSISDYPTLDEFFDYEAEKVKVFLHNQINRVRQVVKSTYIGIDSDQIRDHIDKYFNQHTRTVAQDVNEYVENLKKNGKKVADIWSSFVPTEDPQSRHEHPELTLSIPGIIVRNGYACETHTIISQGYILNVYRIPTSRNGENVSKNTVILQHGLIDSPFSWIINRPDKSLAYILADAGYDVWMTNIRGNGDSKEHAWYKTNTKEFWNFSFHEFAEYDMPAVIDYIRKIKGNDTKIAYIGHSMGTSIIFAMLSLHPEYNDRLTVVIALAPAVFLSNTKCPVKSVQSSVNNAANIAIWFHSYEISQKELFEKIYLSCKDANASKIGEDENQLYSTMLLAKLMKGNRASWKNILHYIQLMNNGKFQQFDYGNSEFNMRVHGEDTPLEYDLSKVKLDISLFWAQNDLVSTEKDVLLLYDKLPKTTQLYMVPHPKFNHLDYLWAKDAPKLVYSEVLEILNSKMKYNRTEK